MKAFHHYIGNEGGFGVGYCASAAVGAATTLAARCNRRLPPQLGETY